jgi:hypothetical protein
MEPEQLHRNLRRTPSQRMRKTTGHSNRRTGLIQAALELAHYFEEWQGHDLWTNSWIVTERRCTRNISTVLTPEPGFITGTLRTRLLWGIIFGQTWKNFMIMRAHPQIFGPSLIIMSFGCDLFQLVKMLCCNIPV